MTTHSHNKEPQDKPQGLLENFAQISGLDSDRLAEDLFVTWQQTLGQHQAQPCRRNEQSD